MRLPGNNVLVKPYPPDEISEGGVIVPESCMEVSNKVYVVAVGPGTKNKPMHLREGETAHRVKGWGNEVLVNGERHFIMDSSAIIAKQHE
jgi:co-chaperonin GroES (HSP10)